MTPPPFPELAIIAAIETAEAVGNNAESAVRFEIGRIVGVTDALPLAFPSSGPCIIDVGDGVINDTLEFILTTLCNSFQSLFNLLDPVIEAIFTRIASLLDDVLITITETIEALVQNLLTTIAAVVNGIVERLTQALDSVVNTIADLVDGIVEQVRSIVNELGDILGRIVNTIDAAVNRILDSIAVGFDALLASATAVIDRLERGIEGVISALVQTVEDVFLTVSSALGRLIDTLTGAAEAGLDRIRGVIEDIPAALREVVEAAATNIVGGVGGPLSNMGTILGDQLENFLGRLIDDLDVPPKRVLTEFLTGLGLREDAVARIELAVDRAVPGTPSLLLWGVAAMLPFVVGPMVSAILSPAIEEVRQEVAQIITPTLIPPSDSIEAFIRGEFDAARLTKELGEAGFSQERIDVLVASSRRLLDLGQLFSWWLREIITEDQLDQLLQMQRISSEDGSRLKISVFAIPPVGDIIQMAVREVFSPEIRERFGQDEGFPPEFAEFGRQQGISEFWAKAYWAAHWILPSPQQGFEMLHRKVIEPADLDLLLRALDVMPFWRDKLTAIAFNPLTRVDLRRMHRLGLLDEEQLQARYEDLGFNADNAALMVQFTLAFNAPDETEAELEIEGLTRATVVNMMEDGILDEREALEILQLMGLSERVANLFVDQRNLELQRAERSALIESIIALVGGGRITFPQAQDSLAAIGLTAVEIARATQRIITRIGGRSRLPTPVQLEKMLELEIIDEEVWRETMGGLDFPEEWVERILILNQTGTQA